MLLISISSPFNCLLDFVLNVEESLQILMCPCMADAESGNEGASKQVWYTTTLPFKLGATAMF